VTKKNYQLTPLGKRCKGCPLQPKNLTQVATETHGGKTRILLIAEAPGRTEDQTGRPVTGVTGQIERRVIKQLNGGTEKGIAYANIVRCRPTKREKNKKTGKSFLKDRPPIDEEIRCCKKYLLKDIERINPQYIVLVGSIAAHILACKPESKDVVGSDLSISQLRGLDYVVHTPSGKTYPATVTFHFSNVSRNPQRGGVFKEDIQKAFIRTDPKAKDYSKRGKETIILDTVPKVKKLLHKLQHKLTKKHIVALDYETAGLERIDPTLLTIGFAYSPNKSYVIPYEHKDTPFTGKEIRQVRKLLQKLFKGPVSFGALVAHNLKFEAAITKEVFGVSLLNVPTECTLLRSHSINENRTVLGKEPFSLKTLDKEWLSFYHYEDPDIAPIVDLRNLGRLSEAPLYELCQYNGMDCYVEWRLYRYQNYRARKENYVKTLRRLHRTLKGPASVFAAQLERNGIRVNKPQIRFLRGEESPILTRIAEIEEELYGFESCIKANELLLEEESRVRGMRPIFKAPWVFKLSKPRAKEILYLDVLKLKPVSHTTKGRPQINKPFYEEYVGVPEIDLLAEWSGLEQIRGTYVEGLYKRLQNDPDMRDGRVRGNLVLGTAKTGRTSFQNPNMQNIPKGKTEHAKGIKRLYVAAPGRLLMCMDYSQAEVRWMAQIANDSGLIRAFGQVQEVVDDFLKNPTKENAIRLATEGDFHKRTASQAFEIPLLEVGKNERNAAKSIMFGNIYGRGDQALATALGKTIQEARDFKKRFFNQFPEASQWLKDIELQGYKDGYVESPIGQRRHLITSFLLDEKFEDRVETYEKEKRKVEKLRSKGRRIYAKRILKEGDRDWLGFRGYERRISRNSPIQSVASDTNLLACVEISRYIEKNKKEWWLCNVVHDSIIADVPFEDAEEYTEVAQSIMESGYLFKPFGFTPDVKFVSDVSVGVNWGDQYDVSPVKTWDLECPRCKRRAEKKDKKYKTKEVYIKRPKKCPDCGSKKHKCTFTAGPLPFILKRLDREHGFTS